MSVTNPPKDMNTSKKKLPTVNYRDLSEEQKMAVQKHAFKKQSLDSIFAEVGRIYRTEKLTQLDLEKLDNMKQAIVEAVEGLIPEKLKGYRNDGTATDELDKLRGNYDRQEGYNQAVDDFLQAIKEWQ